MAGVKLSAFGLKTFATPATPAPEAAPTTEQPKPEATMPATTGVKLGLGKMLGAPPAQTVGKELTVAAPTVQADSEVVSSAEGFKAKLDRFDRLIIDGQDIDLLSLDTARAYVGEIMMELKQNPEYDPLLVDRDVHNIMVFVQKSTILAGNNIVVKKEKAQVREAKKANTTFDLSGFGDDDFGTPKTAIESAVKNANALDAIANLNVDDIESKRR